jgi:hypothetical protein
LRIALAAFALCAMPAFAQDQQQQPPAQTPQQSQQPAAGAPQNNSAVEQVVAKIVARENQEMNTIRQYSPLVETYIQNLKNDKQSNVWSPDGDRYFLGRAQLSKGIELESLAGEDANHHGFFKNLTGLFDFGVEFLPNGFLQMIYLDTTGLQRENYNFDYVRREFLGDVRTLVFDVTPAPKSGKGRFVGRIWVEDQNYTIVRFNGAYTGSSHNNLFFHFDSWRMNTGPNLWLPAFIYSEETDMKYAMTRSLSFKAQTRLWGYNLGHAREEQELSEVLVEGNAPINDESQQNNDRSPLQAQRMWERQAEDNVIDRLERMGLIAPKGDIDKVLETVVNNLEVSNNLDVTPDVRCRVLMTSTLEAFPLGHTIVLSRGLIDVVPDEASLAAILAQELAHIVLGHQVDTQYAFFDKILAFSEKQTFQHFDFARTKQEDEEASTKAVALLKGPAGCASSVCIYKDQLKTPEMFMAELEARSKEIPNLISPKLGDNILVSVPLPADPTKPAANQIVALPLGGRVKLDPYSDKLDMLKTKPVGSITEREKMPFEVTPFMPYLTREMSGVVINGSTTSAAKQDNNNNNNQNQEHPKQ